MKYTLIFTLINLLTFCSVSAQVDQNSIVVNKIKQHPFLVDHCKKLTVFDELNNILDEIEMYCDPGEGCNSYLFDTKKTFTVIDCNGQWYLINKKTGKISTEEWEWEKALPTIYLGTFVREKGAERYSIVIEPRISIRKIYKFKDPNE